MIHHYPLQWPVGWRHTKAPISGSFKVTYEEAEKELMAELERLGATTAYISTDQPLRMDGRPRRNEPAATPGVAVYFVRTGADGQPKQLCIPCDGFNSVRDNLRAVGLTIEAIRRMERYGTSDIVEATLSGFTALPAEASPNSTGPRRWHDVLGVSPDSPIEVRRAAFKALAQSKHPDKGGSTADWLELQKAKDEAGI
jgi:hypothetical protein